MNQYPEFLQYYLKYPIFNKNYETYEETRKCNPYIVKKAGNRNSLWEGPDVRFNKGFKVTIIIISKELKEIMPKGAKEDIKMMFHVSSNREYQENIYIYYRKASN